LGIDERRDEEEEGAGKDPEEAFMDELIYAPLEEIFGKNDEANGQHSLLWMPRIIGEQPIMLGGGKKLDKVGEGNIYCILC
jgi:hypothetical protein